MTHTIYYFFFFFNDTPTTEIYTLSLHDALPISSKRGIVSRGLAAIDVPVSVGKRMLLGAGGDHVQQERSEEHTSELQSHSDLVCRLLLEKKKKKNKRAR